MAEALKATATVARLFQGAHGRCCALVHVKDGCVEDVSYLEMRVAGAPYPTPAAHPRKRRKCAARESRTASLLRGGAVPHACGVWPRV